MIGQKPEQSNVGFTFIIDRSASGGKVKGEEIVKVVIAVITPVVLAAAAKQVALVSKCWFVGFIDKQEVAG